jgi:hypothetical protein
MTIPDRISVRVILSFDDVVVNKKTTHAQQILQQAWGWVEKTRTMESIDSDIAQMRSEWEGQ